MNSEIFSLARKIALKACEGIIAEHQDAVEKSVFESLALLKEDLPDLTKVGIHVLRLTEHPIKTVFGQPKGDEIIARHTENEATRFAYIPPPTATNLYLWTYWAIVLCALRPGHSSLQPLQKAIY